MNTVPVISSPHGIYPASPEAMEKGKETEIGEEPMEMKGMAGGRGISPAAEEGSTLSIASARHDAGMAGIAEAVGCISLCQKTTVQATQQATSEMASATLINRDSSRRIQLPRKLETSVRSRILATISQAEQDATGDQRKLLMLIRTACQSVFTNKLADADKPYETASQYLQRHPEDKVVRYSIMQYEIHHMYATNDIDSTLELFQELKINFKDSISFTERLFIMHLMLGMSVDGNGRGEMIDSDKFYDAIKEWLGANKAEDEAIKQSLETEFGQNAHQVKIFRGGIEAIFTEEDADLKESEARFEQSVNELTRYEKDGTLAEILACSVIMLKFAKGLKLIEQYDFDKIMEDVWKCQYTGCDWLDQHLDQTL